MKKSAKRRYLDGQPRKKDKSLRQARQEILNGETYASQKPSTYRRKMKRK